MNTGDIVLFCGRNNIISNLIRFFLNDKYTHVGIFLKDPIYLDKKYKGNYVLESGYEPTCIFGVQLTPLKEFMDTYPGTIYYRKLKTDKTIEELENELRDIYFSIKDRPYDLNIFDFLSLKKTPTVETKKNNMWDWFSYNNRKNDTFICSSLVGYIYTYWGFFPKDINWSEFEPCSFSNENKELKLINCELDNEIQLK